MAGHCPPPPGIVGKPSEGSGMGWGLLSNMWISNMWTSMWKRHFILRRNTQHTWRNIDKKANEQWIPLHPMDKWNTVFMNVNTYSTSHVYTHISVNTGSYQSQWWGWAPAGGYQAEVGYSWTLWLCWFFGETCASFVVSFWSEKQCVFSCGLMYERSCHSEGRGKDGHLGKVGKKNSAFGELVFRELDWLWHLCIDPKKRATKEATN